MSRRHLQPGLWSLMALLAACTGAEEAPAPEPVTNPAEPPLDAAKLNAAHETIALVPSPLETQRVLDQSGIQTQLSTLVTDKAFDMAGEGGDRVAVRTGVVLADLLLTTKTATDDQLVQRLERIGKGMDQLNGGPDIQRTLADQIARVKAGGVTRDELLKEFDELSGAIIPEMEFNGQQRIVPLIEAGSWLEGANLLSKALKTATDKAPAEKLLKSPTVVDYFLKYVKTEGADKASEAVTKKLEESLESLKALATKAEALTDADLDTVARVTDDVLALL
jgi:hypothetical protein